MVDEIRKIQPRTHSAVVIEIPADIVRVLQPVAEMVGLSVEAIAIDILRDNVSAYRVFDIPKAIRAVKAAKDAGE